MIQNNNLIYTDHGRPFFGGGVKTIKLQFDKFFSGNVVERDFFYREVCTTRTFSKLVREDFFSKIVDFTVGLSTGGFFTGGLFPGRPFCRYPYRKHKYRGTE